FTQPARVADPQAGTRPAPELERHERVQRERAGWPDSAAPSRSSSSPGPAKAGVGAPEPRDVIAVAADVLARDGSRASALETWDRGLANADHLAVLNAMWQGETAGLEADRYRRIVLDALPPECAADGLTSPQATWLWRTLRAAEAAGLDAGEVA